MDVFRIDNDRLDEYDCAVEARDGGLGLCSSIRREFILSGERGTGADESKIDVLSAGVGAGLLNVTFLPPSPEFLLVLVSSDSHIVLSASTS